MADCIDRNRGPPGPSGCFEVQYGEVVFEQTFLKDKLT
jgi:hypothetical protein